MKKRVLSAIVGIAILLLIVIPDIPLLVNIAVAIISCIGTFEFYKAFKTKGYKPFEAIGYIASLSIICIGYLDNEIIKTVLFFALPVILFILFCRSIITNLKYNVMDIAVTVLGVIYVAFLFSFIVFTRHLENGYYYIWYILAGAWATDTFAYLVGVKFGKHKFTEVSPKKSIEGAIGGIIGCAVFYGLFTWYLNTLGIQINIIVMIILGIIVSIVSEIGDLAESSIKRYCEVKDSGAIMPGHGGILDRFDSVLMIVPVIYMFFQFVI